MKNLRNQLDDDISAISDHLNLDFSTVNSENSLRTHTCMILLVFRASMVD
jgi:hypothetical protein